MKKSAQHDHNRIVWKVENEVDVSAYMLERSVDGYSWMGLNKQVSGAFSYEFNDYDLTAEILYYRLLTVDQSGNTEQVDIVSVQNKRNAGEIVKVTNLLGQEIPEGYSGFVLLTYSNGETIKTYR